MMASSGDGLQLHWIRTTRWKGPYEMIEPLSSFSVVERPTVLFFATERGYKLTGIQTWLCGLKREVVAGALLNGSPGR